MGADASESGIHQHFFPAFDLINKVIIQNAKEKAEEEKREAKKNPLADGPVVIGRTGR